MYVFDTDVVTLIFHNPGSFPSLERRLLSLPPEALFVSIVTAEELVQGAFAMIRREQQRRTGTNGYRLFQSALEDVRRFRLLPHDDACHELFSDFRPAVRRLGRSDCMICVSAARHGYTVITRNLRDFAQIPGVKGENWTVPITG